MIRAFVKARKNEIILAAIFLAVLGFRLFFSLSTQNFSDEESYFHLRQIEAIEKNGAPVFNDALSYSGRNSVFLPGMHYLLAGLKLLLGGLIEENTLFKICLNFFAALVVLAAYLIVAEITKNKTSALIAAFSAGFAPIFIGSTVNRISTFSISIPLNLLLLYFFTKSDYDSSSVAQFMITLLISSLVDSLVFVTLVGFLMYLLMINIDEMEESPARVELVLFSLIFVAWVNFIIFKDAFLAHGIGMIWRNIPSALSYGYFGNQGIISIIYFINALPFLAGIYTIYNYTIREKRKTVYVFTAMIITMLLLIWLKLFEFNTALIFLSVLFAIMLGYFHTSFFAYLKKTKFSSSIGMFYALLIVLLVSSTIPSSLQLSMSEKDRAISDDEISGLKMLSENSAEGAVISAPASGYLITYFAGKKNVMDSNFLLVENINERYADVKDAYKTLQETAAIAIFEKYQAKFIYLSEREKKEFGTPQYLSDEKCFRAIYNESVLIYEVMCKLTPVTQ
jgi:hypothetical protein